MPRSLRVSVFVVVAGGWAVGCAHTDTPTADPEAERLAPPVVIIDDPPAEPEDEVSEPEMAGASPTTLAKDPNTEVITFAGEDADPGMADEISGSPKRDPLPSMMSDVIHGPNK